MNGPMKTFKEKQNVVEQYVKAVNPYKKQENLHFDLRKYAKFIEENNISASDVTDEMLNMFRLPTSI